MVKMFKQLFENRGADFPIFFQQEASDIWIIMQRCHWYIWLYLTFILLFVLSMFFFILVDSYSNVRYVRDEDSLLVRYSIFRWEKVTHIPQIEFIWTTLPCFFLLAMGYRSIYTLYLIDTPLNVNIIAKAMGRQWFWQYELVENYPLLYGYDFSNLDKGIYFRPKLVELNLGQTYYFDSYMVLKPDQTFAYSFRRNLSVDNMMSLIVGFPVRFLTTGMDVLHSFAIPSLGIKLDAVPGRLNSCDVVLERAGVYYGQCSELCGQGHGFMPIGLYIAKITKI